MLDKNDVPRSKDPRSLRSVTSDHSEKSRNVWKLICLEVRSEFLAGRSYLSSQRISHSRGVLTN